ncbi:MAG TPA: hydrogenase maturation nickel metallochaperone HypA [bacterium]|nr:hydrogenase maturation nickel metallochaperone HypA [bacterium]
MRSPPGQGGKIFAGTFKMHELGIAINIISIVEKELSARKIGEPVRRVDVRIGKMHAILPASLTFHFDVAKRGRPLLAGAKLGIEDVPVKVRCPSCRREAALSEPIFACAGCGGAVEIVEGEEMQIVSITT